jgi:hypothetical protein
MLLRGDTDFSQTRYLDGWNAQGVEFIFGIDAMPNLVSIADSLEEQAWKRLERPAKYEVATSERSRPENVKEQIVRQRGFKNIRLQGEDVAEFLYRPTACKQDYRIIALRKNLTVARGEQVLFDDIRYFFYITNRMEDVAEIVFLANRRCNQENLIDQLKNGVQAMRMPVDDQTMVRPDLARSGPLGPEVCPRQRRGVADGVQDLRECLYPAALSGDSHRSPDCVSSDGMEPMATGVTARRRCLASTAALLTIQ